MYCAKEDLIAQVANLEKMLKLPTDTGDEISLRIEQAIDNACYEIDGYIGSRYRLPLTVVPHILKKLAIDIAIYNCLSFKGIKEDSTENTYFERYKAAIDFLKGVRDGKNTIGLEVVSTGDTVDNIGFIFPERVFDNNFWRGY